MTRRAAAAGIVVVVLLVLVAILAGPCAERRDEAPAARPVPTGARVGSTDATPRSRARPADAPPEPAASSGADGRVVEVTVRVISPDGAPVGDALVEVFRAQRGTIVHNSDLRRGMLLTFEPQRPERSARTGADGVATFRLGALQGWAFAASKDGFARDTTNTPGFGPGLDLSHQGDRATVVLRLAAECVLTGLVRDEDGRPVPGAVVALTPGTAFEYSNVRAVRATSGDDGRYVLRGLRPGTARVQAAREGQVAVQTSVQLPCAGDLDFVVRTAGHLVGRVLDADGGAPVAGAIVRASTASFGGMVETTSGEDGSFRLPWCLDQPVGRVVAEREGWVTAAMDAPLPPGVVRGSSLPHPAGDGRRVFSIAVPAGTEVRQDVLVTRAGRIRGVVRGDGAPLAGVRVTAATGREEEGIWVVPAMSGADGRFELVSVPASRVLLHATLDGWYAAGHPRRTWRDAVRDGAPPSAWRLDMPPGADVTHDIELARGVAVEGVVVLADGSPVAGAAVHAVQDDVGVLRLRTTSAADGTFRLEGVAPDRPASVWATSDSACMDDEAAEVEPGATARVTLRLVPPARVTGIVTDADGALPPAGTTVTLSVEVPRTARGGLGVPDFAPSTTVEPDGRFGIDIRAPDAARLHVFVSAPGRPQARGASFTVAEARGGRTVEVRLAAAETVRGRVVARDSQTPVAGATIRTVWAAGSVVARTRADGSFAFDVGDGDRAPGQPVRVFVTADDFALGRAETPAGGGEVVVVLDPVGEIAGIVRFADGSAAAGVSVGAERQGAVEGSWFAFGEPGIAPFGPQAITDASGAFRLRGIPAGRFVVLVRPPVTGAPRIRPARSAAVEAGARNVVVVVEAAPDPGVAGASGHDAKSDGELGREAIWRLMKKEPELAAAAWEALLARPLADDARAEALGLYANGPLRTLGRRDDAIRALVEAARLAPAGSARLATVQVDLATVLVEAGRFDEAAAAARDAVATSSGRDALLHAMARLRGAQARARLGDTAAAREEFARLRTEAGTRQDGGWPSVRAIAEAELRR